MNKFNSFTFYPVTGWHIGPLTGHQALVLQFGYHDPKAPFTKRQQESLYFGMTLEMAKKLVVNLSEHIDYAEQHATES
ncbi:MULTISPECIES: hypothetical protein [Pantoea]|uniref:BssS family protein n=1 Tax=Pantoea brenneri TaxID=472694 RepID=A0A653W6U4_9GAMM|nr:MULTISPECIES: hypothetical protein [Pantoea]KKD34049.1 hypothetical protein EP46_09290 [Pantoea sp. 3.5.1]MBS6032530.1 hypothetical protein [Pantoea sp.]MBZ6393812.1 hypothetical protein [Pantoea sp.]MBZ6436810.1 hypothetical protein [Pantoea sp.]MCQ5472398.1 hypothetical protein [Pantoea brenneri]